MASSQMTELCTRPHAEATTIWYHKYNHSPTSVVEALHKSNVNKFGWMDGYSIQRFSQVKKISKILKPT